MVEVKFADIGEGIHEGVLYEWRVSEGDEVKDGDTLFLVETDKVTAEIPSPTDGKVAHLAFQKGDTIHVGDVVLTIDDGEEEKKTADTQEESSEDKEPSSKTQEESSETEELSDQDNKKSSGSRKESVSEDESTSVVGELDVSDDVIASSDEGQEKPPEKQEERKRVLATPVARKMAKDLGVDIHEVKGTGPAGRVMKADIRQAAQASEKEEKQEKQTSTKTQEVSVEAESRPMSMLRKTVARTMVQSKSEIPHAAAMDEFDVTELVAFKKANEERAEEAGIHLTYLPLIIRALVLALKEHPVLNASIDESGEAILMKKERHIGLAVDTPEGLIVPVIREADHLGVLGLAGEIQRLSAAAREKKLKLEDLKGGTFSVTNYGAVGAKFGVPIIKPPEVAILGVGLIEKQAVVRNDEIVIRSILPISLAFDHRVIDGGDAGRFLQTLKAYLESPERMLLY